MSLLTFYHQMQQQKLPKWIRNRERNPLTSLLRKNSRHFEQRKRRSALSHIEVENLISITIQNWILIFVTILSYFSIYANMLKKIV